MFDALRSRWAIFGAVAIGLYVGAEVSIGSFLVNFMGQPEDLRKIKGIGAKTLERNRPNIVMK